MRINDENVSAEDVDGELIAINFATGRYFAMQGVALEIWNWLLAGQNVEQIVAAQTGRAGFDPATAPQRLQAFVDQLLAEGLIIADVSGGRSAVAGPAATPWHDPVLEEFDDMAAMLKLDPVIDIAVDGWPAAPA
ncbi:PqqD family protein [Blastomonas sp. SL216]|uniref:PqqD family protein n=1 Tax=Blastomonas sp. SL216 TaxID=2995169 RepID=UPI002377B866|nr:PqqD family protein [Blastomonas sp. SL216]